MKTKFLHTCFLVLIFAILACKEDDAPVLTGDVKGKVSLYDGYGYALEDQSDVQVQLTGEEVLIEGSTDAAGRYLFEDIPFGNYRINLIKENYIESTLDFRLSHVGGDAATITNQTLNKIPDYRFEIDSMAYERPYLSLYLKITESNRPIEGSFYVHSFFSQTPDVSYENYDNNIIHSAYNKSGSNVFELQWGWAWGSDNFLKDYSDTVYCRVYPQTYCYDMWRENDFSTFNVIPETLGKPSEVYAMPLD